jgi:hypothetical protein
MADNGRQNAEGALIAALACGKSIRAAAALCEVSERTIYRRLQRPAFRRKLARARAQLLDRAIGHLAAGSAGAAVVLRNLLRADDPRVRLGAARAILTVGDKLRESTEMEERIAALEARQRQSFKGGKRP